MSVSVILVLKLQLVLFPSVAKATFVVKKKFQFFLGLTFNLIFLVFSALFQLTKTIFNQF